MPEDRTGPVRLSVVVPAHDAADTVEAALRSVFAQRLQPDEVIVVDDASTDGTATVVAACDPAVRLVRRKAGGPAAARNVGVEASSGEWLAFLDADDVWHPAKLAHQWELVEDGTVLVATDWARTPVVDEPPTDVSTSEITQQDLLLLNRFQTSTVLLSRRTFDAVGGFDPALDGVEDWDMWLRCSRHGRVRKLDWPFVQYADTPAGYSKALDRVYRTGWTMLDRELADSTRRRTDTVLAWHHLRFAAAYLLMGDRVRARSCLADLRRAGHLRGAPEATARYLMPFLAGRVQRRVERLRAKIASGPADGSARAGK
ncbi:MAG: glycosyltransferase family 2 protein [Acidimicrobiales bacterium]